LIEKTSGAHPVCGDVVLVTTPAARVGALGGVQDRLDRRRFVWLRVAQNVSVGQIH
jgi:hypothetical protein